MLIRMEGLSTERRVKGINFTGTLRALEREHGEDVRERVQQRLEGEVGDTLRHGGIVANGWYPASWYAALLRRIVRETDGDENTVRALSRSAVSADFKSIFKVVRLFLSPAVALQQSMRVSSRYVDGGVVEVMDAGPEHVHYFFREYHGYSRLMWWDFLGGIESVLEDLGARDLTVRIAGGGRDGDSHCEVVMRWRR